MLGLAFVAVLFWVFRDRTTVSQRRAQPPWDIEQDKSADKRELSQQDEPSQLELQAIANAKRMEKEALAKAANQRAQLEKDADTEPKRPLTTDLHPAYHSLLKEYPFQNCRTQRGQEVNIILVRAAMNRRQRLLYEKYKHNILFLGISSFEDYPLPSVNPFSGRYPADEYVGLFPGFLHMMHEPQKYFPPHVKTILMSQSDFSLPYYSERDYAVPRKYDFTYSGSDQDVARDCVGWSSFAKNWTFVKQALEVMCSEYNLTGVLVATKDKQNRKACTIPEKCKGLILQTQFLDQRDFFGYLRESRFAFLPQIHDASPRVSTQALAHDVPMLMNAYISGGWKYMNAKTGEFFHDMTDFRQSLEKILKYADTPKHYEPRKYVRENYGDENSGPRLLKFVQDNFLDRVKLPEGTTSLLI